MASQVLDPECELRELSSGIDVMDTLRGRLDMRGDLGGLEAGKGFAEDEKSRPRPRFESSGEGMVDHEFLGLLDFSRSCGGRGEIGTFHMTASSGRSSSES